MDNRTRLALVGFASFIVLPLVVWSLFSVFNPNISTGLKFLVTPDDIRVSFEGGSKTVSYGKVVGFEPGDYTLTLSRDGFKSEERAVSVRSGEVRNICVSLTASGEVGEKVLSEQKDLAAMSEGVFGCQVEQGGEELEELYPFIEKLPISDKYFSATACLEDETDKESNYIICLSMVTLNDFHKKRAKSVLIENGIDVDSVKLKFFKPATH